MRALSRPLNGFKTLMKLLMGVLLFAVLGGLAKTAYALFLYGSGEIEAAAKHVGDGLRNILRNVFMGL